MFKYFEHQQKGNFINKKISNLFNNFFFIKFNSSNDQTCHTDKTAKGETRIARKRNVTMGPGRK
jgi:hypothetical protein